MKTPIHWPDRNYCRLLISLLLAFYTCDRLPAQTNIASESLVPIGSVSLKGVEGRLDHLTADPLSQRLFVAALENHSVEVIDLKHQQRTHSLSGIMEPQGLLFVPRSNRLLVCSRGDGTCRSFDASTFEEGPWVDLGRNADNVRLDQQSGTAYVGSGGEPGSGLLSVIDLISLLPPNQGGRSAPPRSPADLLPDRSHQADVSAEATLPAHPESFQIDPSKRRAFVNVPDEHQISVVSLTSTGIIVSATWPVTIAQKNFPMTLDADASRLFIACRIPPCLASYDTSTGKLLSTNACVGDADDMFFDARTQNIYVIGGEGFLDVFHVADQGGNITRIQRIPTGTRARTGLFIPDLNILAVAVPHTTNGVAAVLLFRTKQ